MANDRVVQKTSSAAAASVKNLMQDRFFTTHLEQLAKLGIKLESDKIFSIRIYYSWMNTQSALIAFSSENIYILRTPQFHPNPSEKDRLVIDLKKTIHARAARMSWWDRFNIVNGTQFTILSYSNDEGNIQELRFLVEKTGEDNLTQDFQGTQRLLQVLQILL